MSTRSGQVGSRKRAQKHQNATAWKADKHKSDPKTKLVQGLTVTNCCPHCTGIIEWKIKYGKYKPLSQPAKCIKCGEKRVKSAYHILCQPCVEATGHCAKCNKAEDVVNKPQPSPEEAAKLESELRQELKALPERKRRTFLRYLKAQEKKALEAGGASSQKNSEATPEGTNGDVASPINVSITQIRKDAKEKLQELKQKFCLEDDFDDILGFEDDDEEDWEEDDE